MGDLAGIGKIGRTRLSKVLECSPRVITSATVVEVLSLSPKEASRMLSRWFKNGWLYRIKRGVYIPNNSGLTSSEIGKAIGHSRQAVDLYIADLRAAVQMDLDLKIFRMHRLGIPQARIAKRLGTTRDIIRDYLGIMPTLAKSPNSDLSRGVTLPQVAEKHGWTEPMVQSIA